MTLTQSDRYVRFSNLAPDGEAIVHRSVPGVGGARPGRRIDVSSGAQIVVTLSAIRQTRSGVEHDQIGRFVLMRGIPLIWPVPNEALGDDIAVVVANRDTQAADVHIMDHWR